MTGRYVALIPAYNPSPVLYNLVRDLCNTGFSIVIVDDGSNDSCSYIFDDCSTRAAVLHHPKNAGKGQAIKTGLHYIQNNFASDAIIVTVDANEQSTVEDALVMCKVAQQHSRALVLGRRSFGKDVALRSRFRSKLAGFMFLRSTGLRIQDPQSGLRAFSYRQIPILSAIEGSRYDYEINVLLHFAKSKIRILEHPLKSLYTDNPNASHFRAVKTALRKT
ncbi:MAG: glycosyltransferase family 2 protein [Oscillospiraceae bacterium]|nr:glycosyltransferase family 2 protein [Oscillospiraceae bacterium]